jgi:hypothetical protein
MLPFAPARAIVRKHKLKGQKEWKAWSKSGQRPSNIPSKPETVYRDDGWISMPDWLGYKGQARHKDMLPFAFARSIVRKLNLKSQKEWKAWSKAGKRPSNIPGNPHTTYRDDGWISYPDWLGKEGGRGAMLPFAVARAIVWKLKLKGDKEWRAWSSSGQRPSNIPSNPYKTYRDDGWISFPDWLGYGSEGGAVASRSPSSRSSSSSNSSSSSSSSSSKDTTVPGITGQRKRGAELPASAEATGADGTAEDRRRVAAKKGTKMHGTKTKTHGSPKNPPINNRGASVGQRRRTQGRAASSGGAVTSLASTISTPSASSRASSSASSSSSSSASSSSLPSSPFKVLNLLI